MSRDVNSVEMVMIFGVRVSESPDWDSELEGLGMEFLGFLGVLLQVWRSDGGLEVLAGV